MPQDMSRAFLITLDRLAFITVLVISRMIDSIRLDSTESRIGSKLSALRDRALAGLALTLVAKLIGRGSSASIGRVWKIGPLRRSRMPASAPVRVPLDRRRHPAARMTGRCARMLCTVTVICQSPEKCKHTKIAPAKELRQRQGCLHGGNRRGHIHGVRPPGLHALAPVRIGLDGTAARRDV